MRGLPTPEKDGLGRVLTPPLYGPPERLEDARAKVADREGVAQAHMDGEDQREMMKPGGRSPDRENGEVFAKVNVHHIGPQGEDGGDDLRLESVELAKAPQGESHSYHAGVLAEALEIRRNRRARGEHRLDNAAPVERPGELGGVVLHPPYGVELYAPADERRRGWLEHRAEPETLIRLRSALLLISQESPEESLAKIGQRLLLHTTLISLLAGRNGDV
jgi:hypothetical protein